MDVSISHDPFAPDSDFSERASHEEQASGEPVKDYDKGKVKDVVKFLGAAPPEIAERVLAYEKANRKSKNVIEAAEKRLEELKDQEPQPVNHADDPETVDGVRDQLGREALEEHERKVADVSS